MADHLEPIEPASPAGDIEVVGRTSRAQFAAVHGVHTGTGIGVRGESGNKGVSGEGLTGVEGVGVIGVSGSSPFANDVGKGVRGEGPIGVFGTSSRAEFAAVAGEHTGAGFGVSGTAAAGNTAGVLGRHLAVGGPGGHGVRGEGAVGVFGISSRADFAAVAGDHTGAGFGVSGTAAAGNTAGVLGRHKGTFEGHGVRGEGPIGVFGKGTPGVDGICPASGGESGTPSGSLAGVRGNAQSGPGVFGAGGYGGQFTGTKAQLHLVPGTILGRPTTDFHEKGEMFIDVAGDLFVCVAGGNPGNWRKVMTVAA
jgi:hypothetical protein